MWLATTTPRLECLCLGWTGGSMALMRRCAAALCFRGQLRCRESRTRRQPETVLKPSVGTASGRQSAKDMFGVCLFIHCRANYRYHDTASENKHRAEPDEPAAACGLRARARMEAVHYSPWRCQVRLFREGAHLCGAWAHRSRSTPRLFLTSGCSCGQGSG